MEVTLFVLDGSGSLIKFMMDTLIHGIFSPDSIPVGLQNGLAILPTKNLVRNIGFTSEATHTKNYNHVLSNLTQYELKFPLKHPQKMVIDYELDKTISKDWFRVNFFSLIRERVYSSNSLSIINNYRKALKNSKQKSV